MERLVLVTVVAALVGSGVAFGRKRSCALASDARACARACEESVCKKGADAEVPKISVFASFIRNIAKQRGISKTEAADLLYEMGVRGFDAGPSDSDLYELAGTCLKPINFYYFPDWFGCKNKMQEQEWRGRAFLRSMLVARCGAWRAAHNGGASGLHRREREPR